jgi:hypothetical protein
MTDTANLGLPCIEGSQAQKHVTHNDALRILDTLVQLVVLDRDLTTPPGSPSEGQRWIVKATGTGAWAGHNNAIAAWQDGAWNFSTPQTGWVAFVADEGTLLVWNGTAWGDFFSTVTAIQNLALLGVGTTADTTNVLNAKLNNTLFAAKTVAEGGSGDLRYKLSKENSSKTLSILFQDNYSGRAEIGLTGDDDFHFKVSPDGSTWYEGIKIAAATGKVSFPVSGCVGLAANNAAVNAAVDVSQELGTTGATLANNTAKYIADQWEAMYNHGAGTAVVTSAQLAAASFPSALAGFRFGHQIKATTAITSPANGDFAKHRQKIEGYRIAHWGWGAAGAAAIVVAFELYSTASGIAFVKLSNSDQSRCFYHEIAVAAGWNFYAINVAGDTGGTWQATTSTGLTVEIFVAGKAATPASSLDAWGSTNSTQTTNSTNLLATNNNQSILTGLFIASGTQLPAAADLPVLMHSFPEELQNAKRYFNRRRSSSSNDIIGIGQAYASTAAFGKMGDLDVMLRGASPTATVSAASHISLGNAVGSGAAACSSASLRCNGLAIWADDLVDRV